MKHVLYPSVVMRKNKETLDCELCSVPRTTLITNNHGAFCCDQCFIRGEK